MEAENLKKLLASSVAIVAIIVIIVAVVSGQKKGKTVMPTQEEPKFTVEKKAATTSLYYSPASQNAYPGAIINVGVYMNTESSTVNGVELKTIYDPNVFEILKVTKETAIKGLAQEIKNSIDNTAGAFVYGTFGLDKSLYLSGSDIFLYTLEVKVKETAPAGTYTISFDPSTTISASGAGQNMFKSSTPHTVVVSNR